MVPVLFFATSWTEVRAPGAWKWSTPVRRPRPLWSPQAVLSVKGAAGDVFTKNTAYARLGV